MEMPAYCGYFCSRCPIYRAGACGNGAASEALARRYSTENRPLSAADIHCEGCREQAEKLAVFCRGCFIRACAVKKRLPHCGACEEYPCGYLKKHIPQESASRRWLDQHRGVLREDGPDEKKEGFHGG